MRILLASVLVCCPSILVAQGDLPRAEQERLWKTYVMNKSNPRILDDADQGRAKWEVIEGMVVIKQVKSLTPLGAALATVAFRTGGVRITRFALTDKLVRQFGERWKGAELDEVEKRRLAKVFKEANDDYWDRHPERKKGVPFDVTFFIRDAKLLEQATRGSDDVVEALRAIARLHGYVPAVESGRDLGFEAYKEAIDKRIPVLMELVPGRDYRVCFGYLAAEGQNCLVLADCAQVLFEQRPPHMAKDDLESESPFVKAAVAMELKRRITADYETGTGKPLSAGITLERFGHMKPRGSFFLYDWEPSCEGLWRDVGKALRCEGKTKLTPWLGRDN